MSINVLEMDCRDVEQWVREGGDVNAFQSYRQPLYTLMTTKSLLERAIELGCNSTVRLLIKEGATLWNKEFEDFYIDVPVVNRPVRERLIPIEIENAEELDGNSFLFLWSLFFKNLSVSQVLYEAFVAQNKEGLFKKTMRAAMMLAPEIGSVDLLNFLLDRGGDALINDESSYLTPFHKVCISGELEMVKILLVRGADPNITESGRNDSPLMSAIYRHHEEIALLLIEHGTNLNAQSKDRAKPLSFAKRHKLKRVVTAIKTAGIKDK